MAQSKKPQEVGIGDRVHHVRLALAPFVGGFVSLVRFGELVAAEIPGQSPFHASTAKRWEEESDISLGTVSAIAKLAQKHALRYATRAWLAFGPEGVTEAVNAPPAPAIVLPPDDDETGGLPRMRPGRPIKPSDLADRNQKKRRGR